jgi:hypothetical protein
MHDLHGLQRHIGRGRLHLLGWGRLHLLGRGGGTSSGSIGGGDGTSSLPRFLDGSLDDAMCVLKEEEALGFTSW